MALINAVILMGNPYLDSSVSKASGITLSNASTKSKNTVPVNFRALLAMRISVIRVAMLSI